MATVLLTSPKGFMPSILKPNLIFLASFANVGNVVRIDGPRGGVNWAFFNDTVMGEPEEDTEGYVIEDDLGQMLREAEECCEIEKESRDLKRMLEDYRTLVYPDCKQDQKKLSTTLELLQWKSDQKWTEHSQHL